MAIPSVPGATQGLHKQDLPELWRTFAVAARRSRTLHYRLLSLQIILIVLIGLAQIIARQFHLGVADWLGIPPGDIPILWVSLNRDTFAVGLVTSALLLVFIALYVLGLILKPDERWRVCRALAEATEMLAWRYSMGALEGDLPNARPRQRPGREGFLYAFENLAARARGLDLPPPAPDAAQITQRMDDVRGASPEGKRAIYLRDRINDQLYFYVRRARTCQLWTSFLRFGIVASYFVLGIGLAPLGGLGVGTTIAGALGTWLGARQFADLGRRYEVTALRLIGSKSSAVVYLNLGDGSSSSQSEVWGQFVDEVETMLAIERRDQTEME
jgi:SMODS and SLOG-associating 2TM effector domain 1/SMODS and SLOG-associating 2TM effector domain 3